MSRYSINADEGLDEKGVKAPSESFDDIWPDSIGKNRP
jgi:hypothetical protein